MLSKVKKSIKRNVHYRSIILGRHMWSMGDLKRKYTSVKVRINKEQTQRIKSFWAPYLRNSFTKKSFDIKWFDIYNSLNLNNNRLEYYIPDDFYHCFIDAYFSDPRRAKVLDDKNMYDMYFGDVKQPRTISRKIKGLTMGPSYELITTEQLVELCFEAKNIIIKKSVDSEGGQGIVFWDKNESKDDLRQCVENMSDFVIQEVIEQHPTLARINQSSVNTIRIMTFAYEGEIKVLSSIIRMGVSGMRVDNATSGGLVCGIDSTGRLKDYAVDIKANKYFEHPSGFKFGDVVIPHFDKCVDLVKSLAPRFYGVSKLISWDLSISVDGEPILIEVNLTYGGVSIHQMTNGPIFGELTEKVLTDVCNNNELAN